MNKKIYAEKVDGFFYTASKMLLFIPLAILVVAVLLKVSGFGTQPSISRLDSVKTTPMAENPGFDLTGPYICIYKEGKTDLKMYVKNKRILATVNDGNVKTTYRVDGDCVYVNSNKTCGIGTYIMMLEPLLKNDLSSVEGMWNKYSGMKFSLSEALKTCKRQDFEDVVFD